MDEQLRNDFTTRVVVRADRHVRLDLDVPADFPEGEAEATVRIRPLARDEKGHNGLQEIRGKGRGRFWMSNDFDEPLEDFAEYM